VRSGGVVLRRAAGAQRRGVVTGERPRPVGRGGRGVPQGGGGGRTGSNRGLCPRTPQFRRVLGHPFPFWGSGPNRRSCPRRPVSNHIAIRSPHVNGVATWEETRRSESFSLS
jgi:hypothetical protein